MQPHLILTGCILIATVLLLATANELQSTGPIDLQHNDLSPIPDLDASSSSSSTTIRAAAASPEDPTDLTEDTGPSNMASNNMASSSRVASVEEEPLPTVPGISDETAGTTSLVLGVIRANPDDSEAGGYSQRDVVVIAVCVSLLSLVVVVLSIAMTFLIRRRMRQKAYLRVKHASQTELAVHYVQNTPASAAARDLVMGQLFESLASMDADGPNDFQIAYSSDDQFLSPSESIVGSELVDGKNRMYSRSMPSLKNLNAHEEALNCNFSFVPSEVNASGKRKGRSRSFTEKTVSGVGIEASARGKNALRSHSEKSKNRLAVVSILTPRKRFEKRKEKSSKRRSTPSFSHFAKFNILRSQSSKQKATTNDATRGESETIPNNLTIAVEQTPLTRRLTSESDANVIAENDSDDLLARRAKCSSTSLSDFEMPNVSPILHEMKPMLAALRMNGGSSALGHNRESTADDINTTIDNNDVRVFRDVPNRLGSSTDKATSLEEVTGEYSCRNGKATPGPPGKAPLSSSRQTRTSQTSRSVNDLDAMRTTVV